MFNPDGVPVWAVRHPLDGDIASHEHEFLEIALVTQGTAVHLSPEGDQQVRAGSTVIVAPTQWHGYAQCDHLVVFDCFVAPELLDGTLAFLDQELALLRMVHLPAPPQLVAVPQVQLDRLELSRAVAELHGIADTVTGERSLTSVVGHLLVYLDILERAWQSRHHAPIQHRRQHPVALHGARLMEADLAHPWTLAELASRLAVERTHLVRLFRQSIGTPPMTYLNRRRAQKASALLVRSDRSVASVGAQVGWSEAAYFSRRFKAFFGLSPSAYRRRALSGAEHFHQPAAADAPLPVSGARYQPAGRRA